MDLRLLGPVEAYAGGIPLALGAPRQRAVLATLLLKSNKPVSTEQLVQAVWDDPPRSANANIRTYVAGLRRVFRDVHDGALGRRKARRGNGPRALPFPRSRPAAGPRTGRRRRTRRPGGRRPRASDELLSGYDSACGQVLDPLRQWPVHPVDESFAVPVHDRSAAESWLETERVNLVAAVVHTARGQDSVARFGPGLAGALLWFLQPRMYVQDQLAVGAAAVDIARRLEDRASEAWGLEIMAHSYLQTGFYGEQETCLNLANKIWLELGDRDGEQRTLCNLAIAARALGDSARSIILLNRQIAIAGEIGNQVAELVGKVNLGETYGQLGRFAEALAYLNDAYEMALFLGDERNQATVMYEIGKLYLGQERFDEARAHMRRALPGLREVGDKENEAELLIMLSRTHRMLGDLDEVLACCERGLQIGNRIGNWRFGAAAIHERRRVLAALAGSG